MSVLFSVHARFMKVLLRNSGLASSDTYSRSQIERTTELRCHAVF